MVLRIACFVLAVFLPSVAPAPAPRSFSPDNAVLRRAALMLASGHIGPVIAQLRRLPAVREASLGTDGRTLELTFRDGQQAAVLPPALHSVSLSQRLLPLAAGRAQAHQAAGTRALVAEPFATELALGPHAGDVEADDLRYAGFAVDQVFDGAVTVDFMRRLSQYSVIYMLSHSGVNKYGEGVVATGQLANDDASVQPLLDDDSLLKVGVVGSTNIYYGILSHFITTQVGQFPAHAIVFLNGCSLLKANIFWQALAAKGAGVLLSWDDKGVASDDTATADAFFGEMIHDKSVADATSIIAGLGYGVSAGDGINAKFGYLGDGSIRLADLAPAPTPSAVPPTPTPTATLSPTATPTVAPLTLVVRLHRSVRVGQRQIITAVTSPAVHVHFRLTMQGHLVRAADRIANDRGQASLSFRQKPQSARPATIIVTVTASLGTQQVTARRSYLARP